jgi:hypothetical protein
MNIGTSSFIGEPSRSSTWLRTPSATDNVENDELSKVPKRLVDGGHAACGRFQRGNRSASWFINRKMRQSGNI